MGLSFHSDTIRYTTYLPTYLYISTVLQVLCTCPLRKSRLHQMRIADMNFPTSRAHALSASSTSFTAPRHTTRHSGITQHTHHSKSHHPQLGCSHSRCRCRCLGFDLDLDFGWETVSGPEPGSDSDYSRSAHLRSQRPRSIHEPSLELRQQQLIRRYRA
jgi:hypothetical protein